MTRTFILRIIRVTGFLIVSGLIIAFAIWRSFNYARGPAMEIFEPSNGSSIASNTATIRGKAERVISLSLNGKSISVDEQGNWNETVIIFPGLNILTISATDQFERTISEELRLVGIAPWPSSAPESAPISVPDPSNETVFPAIEEGTN